MYPQAITEAIQSFQRLPGIGKKSAQRMVQHLLSLPADAIHEFSDSLLALTTEVGFCQRCFHITTKDMPLCVFCSDSQRDTHTICVVEEFIDVFAIEQTKSYRGLYHVLHGAISPLHGVGPQKLKIAELLERLQKEDIEEILFATNPTMEGDATAMYIKKYLPLEHHIRLTRIAKGMPMGGDIDYADEVTLGNSLTQRTNF